MIARRPRRFARTALLVAAVAALSLLPVAPARSAVVNASTQVGWARVARVVWRKVQPWILTLADLVYDSLTGGDDHLPPPPPPAPIDPPPLPDPDYTP